MYKLDKDIISNFTIGLLMAQLVGDIVYLCTHSFYGGVIFAIFLGFLAGILKELWDAYNNYLDVSIEPIIASMLGTLIGTILVIIVLI